MLYVGRRQGTEPPSGSLGATARWRALGLRASYREGAHGRAEVLAVKPGVFAAAASSPAGAWPNAPQAILYKVGGAQST